MITGEEKPDGGTISIGDTVTISYVDQSRGGIDPDKNVWEAISDGRDVHPRRQRRDPQPRAYVAAFGFKGSDQQKPAGVMSGGERNRMNLALTLKQGGNLLLLDEPTNDLDVETLRAWRTRCSSSPAARSSPATTGGSWTGSRPTSWPGKGGANWFWFEGNFESYEKNKIERLGAEAARPHRVTYRKLTRG